MSYTIRRARESDRPDFFRICLLTAHSGTDGTELYSDPDYPGLVWAVPYLHFAPDHAFVVDAGSHAVGYIVGTPDTQAFEARLDEAWWPELQEAYADRIPERPSDILVLDRIKNPAHSDAALATSHPAHLHVNLLPEAQSGGWGRKLIETELQSLRSAGATALHLGVSLTNERAMGFYRHLGFSEISRDKSLYLGLEL
ncbi:GNAT family N-acetyltransferase [Rhizobium binxianense]